MTADRFEAVLLGTCVGDALGLPREGMSRQRAQRRFGGPPLHHQFIFGCGMASDDFEHTCMTAQSLLASGGDPQAFARSLAWRLRGWLLALPAGVGLATARAIVKLWIGFSSDRSGVWSAGNGPAMRAAVIGVYAGDDTELLKRLVHASTVLTHRDPAAEHGALAVALAATCRPDEAAYLTLIRTHLGDAPIVKLIEDALSYERFEDYLAAAGLERGVTGYINHTVPAAIYCWLKWPNDFRKAVEQIIVAGGDTDSTAAIVGGLVAINLGVEGIPVEWRDGLCEWPRSRRWVRGLAESLSVRGRPVGLIWPALLLRNILFLLVVFLHGVRRLALPYYRPPARAGDLRIE